MLQGFRQSNLPRMTTHRLSALECELGGDAPAALAGLDDADLAHLTSAIAAAHRRQGEELRAAGDQALGFVPRLLRAPIRRIVG